MKLKTLMYKISRNTGKAASILSDVEALASGDTKKIAKRAKTKIKNKIIYKVANKISKNK